METMKKHLKEAFKPVLQHYAGAILLCSFQVESAEWCSLVTSVSKTGRPALENEGYTLTSSMTPMLQTLHSQASYPATMDEFDKCTEVKWWWLSCRRPSEDSAGIHITNIPGYFMNLWRSMRDVGNVQCYTKKGCCVSVWKWSRRENPASSENHGVTAGGHRSFGFQSSLSSYWFSDYAGHQQRGELYQQLHTFTSLSLTLLRRWKLLKLLKRSRKRW